MSELKRIVREFGRKVEEAENRTAKTLGEVGEAIKITDKERRKRIADALADVEAGAEMIAKACRSILAALDQSEQDTGEIVAQVEGMKSLRLAEIGKPTLIAGGKTEEAANG